MDNILPRVKEVVYVPPQKNWSFPLHSHENSAELSLIIGGRGTFYAFNQERQVCKGMLVAKNPRVSHAERSDPEDPLEQICIEIDGIHTEGLADGLVIPAGVDPVIDAGAEYCLLEGIFRFLMANCGKASGGEICCRLLEVVLLIVSRKARDNMPAEKRRSKNRKELASEVLSHLDAHYREKIRISDLADMFYVSEGTLSRQFKKVTGYTINEYILSKRMGEAQRLLAFEDCEIKEAAERCGYDDIQYFYHVFKSFAHCTPAEFREKYRKY